MVELMVALGLGLLLLAGMLDAFNSNSATGTTNVRFAEVQTNGRYAIDLMRRELQHVGYLGFQTIDQTGLKTVTKHGNTGTTNYGGCGAGFVTSIERPIWGTNNANTLSCTGLTYSTGDVLVLRRARLERLAGAPSANMLVVRPSWAKATVYLGSNQASIGASCNPADLEVCANEDYPLDVDVYYIRPWTNSSSESLTCRRCIAWYLAPMPPWQ
jgi:type IV pilus assembly protein PilW